MAKIARKSKRRAAPPPPSSKSSPPLLQRIDSPRGIAIFFVCLFILLVILYKPLVLNGYEVGGGDAISNLGKTHQIKLYHQKTGHRALWNPYMFGGMPIYGRYGPIVWNVDTLVRSLDVVGDWRVWYLLTAALGLFFLIKYLGLGTLPGMFSALAYVLLPHYHALIAVGHNDKIKALGWLPWVILGFLYFVQRRTLLSMLLFALAFALQMRTQHYQIVFYTMMLMAFLGFWPYIKLVLEKQWSHFLKFNGLLAGAVVLVLLAVAQPLLPIKEYLPYSTRGGKAISLKPETEQRNKKGVGFEYATQWSYSVSEFWNLIVPKFHGGTSSEVYTGNAVPQFRGRQIPAYWGSMPFTQSYEYLGIVVAFLAVVGVLLHRRQWLVRSLGLFVLLACLLALGKHFAPLYKLFFYYLPYFDKFRVPMMILTTVMFVATVLAAYGLEALFKRAGDPATQRTLYWVGGFFLVLLLIPLLLGGNLALSQPGEVQRFAQQYGQQQAQQIVELLRRARLDILRASVLRTLLFFLLAAGTIFALLRHKLKAVHAGLILIVLTGVDLMWLTGEYLKGKFVDPRRIEAQAYAKTRVDPIIEKDPELFRVSPPIRQISNDTRWSYYYQSIGGYSAIKLQVVQDVFDNCLLATPDPSLPFNLNIFRMANVKYLAENQEWHHPALMTVGVDKSRQLFLHANLKVLPRAYFVRQYQVMESPAEVLRQMNSPEWDPAQTALLVQEPQTTLEAPDSAQAEVVHFEPDQIVLKTFTDKPALLVLSEVYYPVGWKAHLEDGTPVPIYQTNHLLRSMPVPAGDHQITLTFHPPAYFTGIRLSLVGHALLYLGILISMIREKPGWWNQLMARMKRVRAAAKT
ncbi:MAG: hypothetical protein D6715_12935 [Calditrichaeota bacterium]|nr:MAG: hypothetical protein D6715_12935 [Calditrichota bacterium]